MTQTIAEKMPEQTRKIAAKGFPNIAELAGKYKKFSEIDAALGHTSAAHHWFNLRNKPSASSEKLAGFILDGKGSASRAEVPSSVKQTPENGTNADGEIFMVICPPQKASKVNTVLTMLGCEVVSIY